MKTYSTLVFALLTIMGVVGQSTYKNIQLTDPIGKMGFCEPSIAIHPKNPAHMVVGSVLNHVHYSMDSGNTWSHYVLKAKNGVWGDPVLVADSMGRFYFFHLSDPDGTNWQSENILDRIVVQRSDDNGQHFTHESYMGLNRPKQQDKQWAVVAPKTQQLYCTWTEFDKYKSKNPNDKSRIRFSKGNPGGMEWTSAITLSSIEGSCMDDNFTTEGAVPAVGDSGEVYVAWARDEKIWFNRSLDDGNTWLAEEVAISDQVGGWKINIPGIPRANGFPVTIVDHSDGPYKGSIYVMFSDARNGKNNQDIFIITSRDKGETWSTPKKVNSDRKKRHQFFPWLTIDQHTGILYAVFYDRRNYRDTRTDVYLASSSDGGQTWENERISATPFLPIDDVFFGDYNNIAAVNGIIRPVWTRYENQQVTIWTAIINKKTPKK